MTAPTLLVIFLLVVGASAYLTYLVVDAAITEPLRDRVITILRGPNNRDYEQALDEYRQHLNDALERGDGIPTDPPAPPEDPWTVKLLSCRFCTGLWVSLVVVFLARLGMTADYQPIWDSLPMQGADLLVIPAWALASAYTVGFLSTREGE